MRQHSGLISFVTPEMVELCFATGGAMFLDKQADS